MIFFGITMYSYGIAWYAVPLFLIIAGIYMAAAKKIKPLELVLSALTYLLVAWPVFATVVVNVFKLHSIVTPFFTIPYFPGTARTSDILFFGGNIGKQLLDNMKYVFNIVILQKPDQPWNNIPAFGNIYLFSVPFLLFGFGKLLSAAIKNRSGKLPGPEDGNKRIVFPIFIWLIVALISGIVINGANVNRINIIFYPLIILTGLGIYLCVSRVKLFGIVILLTYAIAFSGFCASYFGPNAKIIGQAFYDGFGQSIEYVRDLNFDKIYITDWTQSEGSYWVSEPLAQFYDRLDALYIQGKADAYSKRGVKLLPYKERYQYTDFRSFTVDPNEKAVYIVRNEEIYRFDKTKFIIVNFKTYDAIIPNDLID